jgi:iron(III) transport system ATP-binding protein
VSLARALSTEPAVLLLDEPFSNLDAALRAGVRAEVRALLKKSGTTAVFVTHDQEEALLLGDCLGVMNNGQLEQVGTPEQVFHRPKTRFVAEFLGQTRFLGGEVTDRGIETAMGTIPRPGLPRLGATVEIVVRPDDVVFNPDPTGQGQIVARNFTGMAYIYDIRLADGIIVQSWQPHEIHVAVGTAVAAWFREAESLPVFHDGRLVETS